MVAREGDFYSLVESSVVHLPFEGQVGPDYEVKHHLLVSFPSNVPSWIVEDIAYQSQNKRTLVILSMLQFILTLLLLLVKLDRSLTRFPVDAILGILPGESYSGIRALVDLCVCVNKYQQAFWRPLPGTRLLN